MYNRLPPSNPTKMSKKPTMNWSEVIKKNTNKIENKPIEVKKEIEEENLDYYPPELTFEDKYDLANTYYTHNIIEKFNSYTNILQNIKPHEIINIFKRHIDYSKYDNNVPENVSDEYISDDPELDYWDEKF